MTKKTVHYRKDSLFGLGGSPSIKFGSRAFLQTLDHPSPNVTNWPKGEGHVLTSPVISIGENGDFETENTYYKVGGD